MTLKIAQITRNNDKLFLGKKNNRKRNKLAIDYIRKTSVRCARIRFSLVISNSFCFLYFLKFEPIFNAVFIYIYPFHFKFK